MATAVKTSTTGIVTTFGKFSRSVEPGLTFYIPLVQRVYHVSNRTQQKEFKFRVKTKDQVFANLSLALQYRIQDSDTSKAFFSLDKPIEQMGSYIENSLRSHAPKTTLTSLFESFDKIGNEITTDLKEKMKHHGFTIENILMTGIDPDPEVTAAINSVGVSERLKEAAKNTADAEYIKKTREAEGDKMRKIFQGEGVAGQRKAILEGYRDNIADMTKTTGLSAIEILNFILKSQELDTKEQIGKSKNTKILFMEKNGSLTKDIVSALETQTDKSDINTNTDSDTDSDPDTDCEFDNDSDKTVKQ
jgi:regulator of protease activity HflC (stomatin/prohibitin superfamily)